MNLTGTVIVRGTTIKQPEKKVLCVFGFIAVPKDNKIVTGCQYPVVGTDTGDIAILKILTEEIIKDVDGSKQYRNFTVDQLLTSKIWQV